MECFFRRRNNNYVVIQPPIGSIVTYLPEGCIENFDSNNPEYPSYNCSGIFYEPVYQNYDIFYRVRRY